MEKSEISTVTLTVYGKRGDNYGVTWQTQGEGHPAVRWTNAEDESFSEASETAAAVSPGIGTYKNSAVISGLKRGKKYLWQVGDTSTGEWSEIFSFKTLPTSGDVSFYYMADTQDVVNNGTYWKKAFADAKEKYPGADFTVHGGDIVHMSGMKGMWCDMLGNVREYVTSMPMIPAAGNHDWWDCYLEGYTGTFEKHFTLDYPPQNIRNGVYYSADVGDIHFTVLNSGDPILMAGEDGNMTEQMKWLISDLEGTDKKWKIVVLHNPLYSPGKYGCKPGTNYLALSLRENLNEIFAKYGVDMILSGHDHIYSRSYPINENGEPVADYLYTVETVDGIEAKIALNPGYPVNFLPGCAGNQNRLTDDAYTEEYGAYLEEKADMEWGYVGYSYFSLKEKTLTVSYRMISYETGECKIHRVFGIRKD